MTSHLRAFAHILASGLFFFTISLTPSRATAQQIDKGLERQLASMMSCAQDDPIRDTSPCNRFVGTALHTIFCVDDFGPDGNGGYLDANAIADQVVSEGSNWKPLGSARLQNTLTDATSRANNGEIVIATMKAKPEGHVALILPGPATQSGTWNLDVPRSANFQHNNPKGAQTYVGDKLSLAFNADDVKADHVTLYVHAKHQCPGT